MTSREMRGSASVIMEDLAQRLDEMDVATSPQGTQHEQRHQSNIHHPHHHSRQFVDNHDNVRGMSIDEENVEPVTRVINGTNLQTTMTTTTRRQTGTGCILIVTNVDPIVFSEAPVKAKFESLFRAYDENVLFRYLKSFRRVRLDFSGPQQAELARVSMSNYKLGSTSIKCYLAQMIRPNNNSGSLDTNEDYDDNDDDDAEHNQDNPYKQNSNYLSIPKRTKQFLLSPPISPPEGWMPQEEATPCIDVQLISALANLVPGEVHELHEGNESQPHIFVEVCEEAKQDAHLRSINSARGRIPKTPSPLAAAVAESGVHPMES